MEKIERSRNVIQWQCYSQSLTLHMAIISLLCVDSILFAEFDNSSYVIREATSFIRVCVSLVGRIARDVQLELVTEDQSAECKHHL